MRKIERCGFSQLLILRFRELFLGIIYIMCLILTMVLWVFKTRMVFYLELGIILRLIHILLQYRYIKILWRFQGDFTHILSIFLILFLTIFCLCICSWFLEIFLFLLVVSFCKTFVFRIVVCRFKLKLLRWLLELLIFMCFYCNALVLQFMLNKFDKFFVERILSNKLVLN